MNTEFLSFKSYDKTLWQKQIEKELKGTTYDDLSKVDRNGINRPPFYAIEDRQNKALNSAMSLDWDICSNIVVKDVSFANKEALSLLGFGASGLIFEFDDSESISFNDLLQGVEIKFIHLCFKFRRDQIHLYRSFKEFIDHQGVQLSDLNCIVLFDPIATQVKSKEIDENIILNNSEKVKLILNDTGCIAVNGTIYNNSGSNSVFELACVLAQINEYLNFHQQNSTLHVINKVYVSVAVDVDFFEQIAKLRALRALVEFLLETYLVKADVHIHVENSGVNMSPLDVNNNLLRTSVMGSAAALGGCNSLLLYPYSDTNKSAARLAINQQLVFKEESHFNKVTDPAAGSYYLECLTESIAETAWSHFKEIEKRGGLIACLSNGFIQQQIEIQKDALLSDYITGKSTLIGVNKHVVEEELINFKNSLDLEKGQHDSTSLSIAKELVKS